MKRILAGAVALSLLSSAASAQFAPSSTPLSASSGNVAAATATATLPANPGNVNKTTYLTAFEITGSGATAASIVVCTITGLVGGASSFVVAVPAGPTNITPIIQHYPQPVAASAPNTAIALSCPSFGTGNTNAAVNAYGYQQ